MEKWKVRPRNFGKLANWQNGKLGPEILENWQIGKMGKLGPEKLENWQIGKMGKLGPEKLENGKIGKLGPGKLGGYAPECSICKR